MSMTTCARSGGAVLYRAGIDREAFWPLAQMQRDLDAIASRTGTHRTHDQARQRSAVVTKYRMRP